MKVLNNLWLEWYNRYSRWFKVSNVFKRIIIVFIICFTILLLTGIAFYFYNTLQQTEKNESFHLSEIKTAKNLSEMIEEADVIVIGQYEGLNSTVNLIREEEDETKESTEEYLGGKIYNFHIDETLKGEVEEDSILLAHRYSKKFAIDEILGHEDKEVEEADPTYINPSMGKTYVAFLKKPKVEDFYEQSAEPYLIKVDDNEQVEVKSNVEDDLNFDDTIEGKSLEELKEEIKETLQ